MSEEAQGPTGDQQDERPDPRTGEDIRRRGWYWHWNSIVTQYAPLIGLKGIGLLNSYTVWTDRREDSPYRGFAFPSQQAEAAFYGEDRAELITINKILVALDLIEVRKEMVLHVDDRGRRWRVPHNLYRVKDNANGFTLTVEDVLRVAELASDTPAVYRYIRRVFSPGFAPIDAGNPWRDILPAVRQTETWRKLAEKAAREDARASARSKAGHRKRKGAARNETQHDDSNTAELQDSEVAQADRRPTSVEPEDNGQSTVVDGSNNGSAVDVDESNRGFSPKTPTIDEQDNEGGSTVVDAGNTTYNQEDSPTTTTTTVDGVGDHQDAESGNPPSEEPGAGPVLQASTTVVATFESANDRPTTTLERELLGALERDFADAARRIGQTPAAWVVEAIHEAVNSGSRFVAPKRVREILSRWSSAEERRLRTSAQAKPVAVDKKRPPEATRQRDRLVDVEPTPLEVEGSQEPVSEEGAPEVADQAGQMSAAAEPAPRFTIIEGLSSTQLWVAAQDELRSRMSSANFETWIRPASLIGRDEQQRLVLGVPNRFAQQRVQSKLQGDIESVLSNIVGEPVRILVVVARQWLREQQR